MTPDCALVRVPEPPTAFFGDARDDLLARAIGYALAETRKEMRAERNAALVERDRRIGMLEGEIRELRGMLGATLTLLGKCNGPVTFPDSDRVVEIPKDFMRRRTDAA